jgi:hypothetical protein
MKELDIKILNICGIWEAAKGWADQREFYPRLKKEHPQHFAWCTTFDLPRFGDKNYVKDVIAGLEQDFKNGACSVKVWKNLGMEVKKPDGSWFEVDDPLLTPIFEYITEKNKTLLMHIAEPLACWQPLKPGTPHHNYYKAFPEWHMYGKPGVLSHEQLMASRDKLVARHPKLRCVGAHLASLEYDTDALAQRLKKYPNLAVDTSARQGDLMLQDSAKVRKFFIEFQDRIMFGTDYVMWEESSNATPAQIEERVNTYRENVKGWLQYLQGEGDFTLYGRTAKCLNLPQDVVQKVVYSNMLKWYPEF